MKLPTLISTLNEARNLKPLLEWLEATPGIHEVVIVDGGSADGTREFTNCKTRLVISDPGRGHQLRAGAGVATGAVLFFLHADVLPPDAAYQIERAVNAGYVGGNFRLRYPATAARTGRKERERARLSRAQT